jgi:hypothetical protein
VTKRWARGTAVIKTPEDLQKVRQHLLDLPVIGFIADDLRELVETEWPELVHKLPPKEPPA